MTDSRMKWALLIIITFFTLLLLSFPLIAYWLTGNWLTLTSAAGSIPLGFAWTWITKRVFPLNEKDHERELAKITHKTKRTQIHRGAR